ncbi:ABC1 family protein [Paenibacillus sp. oral taxon 786 str. D14]|uniref:ABC1 kinase family protein n=1 Tax=Paenibacillus sp. oral taxon 786 TaxID=652715 RepID=UPI0001AFCF06|nr:AarF/ABC1/UbiB kinase family protein [Paenibacillus sp. oral taxon 786]EES74696.1 ABC1 family protein [Paenibacillus sp. oral taxon 786 str. D14]
MSSFVRHTGRYREIAMALGRHGFGYLAEEIGLARLIRLPSRPQHTGERGSRTLAERIRLVLEELGPTFVKVGQLASTRSDLLPEAIIQELVKLQDQVPPFPAEEARAILEAELEQPLAGLFQSFDETPLAAASIGQVHRARLITGEPVAIKIQRPGIAPVIEMDLDILQHLTTLANKRWSWVSRYQIPQMVEEFARSIRAELDYGFEGRNMERIRRQFKADEGIYIPAVHWPLTTSRVLTMEFVEGQHLNRLLGIDALGYDRKDLAERLVNALLRQIFEGGFFHADPHPGNLLVTSKGELAFIDFGMVGRLSEEMKDHLSSLVIALMRRSTEGMVRAILRMGLVGDDADTAGLRMDLDRLRERYYDIPFAEIQIGQALQDLFATAQKHHVVLPADLLLLGKALLTVEGVALALDPDLRILDLAEPFGRKLMREKYAARRLGKKLFDEAYELADSLVDLPQQIRNLSSALARGKLKMDINVPEMEQLLRKLDQISNRLSFSIVLLAFSIIMVGLIIGSSLSRMPTLLWNIPAIEIGFVVATLMFLWLLYSIFRSGRF